MSAAERHGMLAPGESGTIGTVIYRFGDYELDEGTGELRRAGARVEIQPKPFELLRLLVRERARIVSADELMRALWPDVAVTPSSLTRAVSLARRAIGDTHKGERIQSAARRGYRFVCDVREGAAPTPGGAPSEERQASPFVGREDALAALRAAFEAARAGHAGLALITGRAGIGKTRLAEAFGRECERAGARVLESRCRDREGAPPYWMWTSIGRRLMADDPEAPVARRAQKRADELGLFGADRARHDVSLEQMRFLFFEAGTDLLRHAARETTLVIVLEDVQWAASESLRMLEHIVFELKSARLLLVVTVRDEGPAQARPVDRTLAALRPLECATTIELRAFSRREVGELLARAIGRPAPADLTTELTARTEGVPLFLREAIRTLQASGELAHPEKLAARSLPLGEQALALLRRSLDALPERSLALLQAGAVIGREFPSPLAAEVAGFSREETAEALDQAAAAGAVEPLRGVSATWRFAHALHREAIYEGIAPGRRARLHHRAAERIEQRAAPDLESVASELSHHHFEALTVGDAARALEFAERAATRSTRRLSWDDAATHLARAVAAADQLIPSDPPRKLDLLLRLGEAYALARDPEGRRRALLEAAHLAISLGRDAEVVRAAIAYCDLSEWVPSDPDAERLLRSALERCPAQDVPARAQLETRLAYRQIRVDGALAAQTGRGALARARETAHPRLVQEAAYVLEFALAGPDHLDERAALGGEIERAMTESPERATGLIALLDLACDKIMRGDAEAARAMRRRAGALAGDAPHFGMRWHLLTYDAGVAALEGRLADSEQIALEALAAGQRARHPFAQGCYDIQRVSVGCERGDPSAALERFSPFLGRERAGWGLPIHWLAATVARARLYAGDRGGADALWHRLAAPGFDAVPRNIRWTRSMAEIAHLCAELGASDAAAELIALIEPRAEQHACVPIPVAYAGPLRAALGRLYELLGRRDAAAETYGRALDDAERLGARCWRARLLLDVARVDRDAKRAHVQAEQARAEAEAIGMLGLAKRAGDEMARRSA